MLPKHLVILGGSLGARSKSSLIEKELGNIQPECSKLYGNAGSYILRSKQKYNSNTVQVVALLKRMDLYASADISAIYPEREYKLVSELLPGVIGFIPPMWLKTIN
jgi:hypothetical protein